MERIRRAIARHGPLSFDRYMELALYDEDQGFYSQSGSVGRRGDFITSPEVGPLFGVVMARALDHWWKELGRPNPYVVIEAGAGSGMLARTILAAHPECASTLRYVLVERSAAQRARQSGGLALESPSNAFPVADDPEHPPAVSGPIAVSLAELPTVTVVGVVLANELLDNLPFALLHRGVDGWQEVLVGARGDQLVEVLVEAPIGHRDLAHDLAPDAPVGSRIPVSLGAWSWLARALGTLERGRVVAIDYAAATAELAERPDWLRTYRQQQRGHDPLAEPGERDITADVPIDQLARTAAPTIERTQAEFLRTYGIDELVAEGRRVWTERAAIGDLEALRARSRVGEAEALCDPDGLGAFTVMEWVVS